MSNSGKVPKCLIVSLYVNENEEAQSKRSVMLQKGVAADHRVIRGLPNKEAHAALYKTIMENAHRYDVFVKLDADMVFCHVNSLKKLCEFFQSDSNLDHLVSCVRDVPSRSNIFGLHAFSNRVKWKQTREGLFVDPPPQIPGRKILLNTHPAPFAYHMPDPSLEQAYTYGYHRALKIKQAGRIRKRIEQIDTQIQLLQSVGLACSEEPTNSRFAILLGANDALASRAVELFRKDSLDVSEEKILERLTQSERVSLVRKWTGTIGRTVVTARYRTLPLLTQKLIFWASA